MRNIQNQYYWPNIKQSKKKLTKLDNMKFDFILFENNSTGFENHFLDISIIASLLKESGYSVAIANFANERKLCKPDVTIIDIQNKYEIPQILYRNHWLRLPFQKTFSYLQFKRRQNKYARCFLNQVKDISDNFYCGSHTKDVSLVFLSDKNPKKIFYFWGLRSWWFTISINDIFKNPFRALNIYRIKRRFIRYKNYKLFVSNEIIKDEFLKLGFCETQLILRPERVIKSLPETNSNKASKLFTILSLGYIRPDKRIEIGIDAFNSICKKDMQYSIRGDCMSLINYRDFIINKIAENDSISYINSRLDEQDYIEAIESSHFLLFCDKKQRSSVSNGTMMDALFNNRPIIAPNYLPYSYYVNKYHVGLLYEPNIHGSLEKQIVYAQTLGFEHFLPNILQFQKLFLIENIKFLPKKRNQNE